MLLGMASCSHAKCPACSGSGIVSMPAPPAYDEKKVLRGALYRVWTIVSRLEEELAAARRKDKNELAAALEKIDRLESRIKIRDDEIAYLNKTIKIAHGWNGRPSKNGPALKTRREFPQGRGGARCRSRRPGAPSCQKPRQAARDAGILPRRHADRHAHVRTGDLPELRQDKPADNKDHPQEDLRPARRRRGDRVPHVLHLARRVCSLWCHDHPTHRYHRGHLVRTQSEGRHRDVF